MYMNLRGSFDRCYYCHITRCGGTTINRTFFNAFDDGTGYLYREATRDNAVLHNGLVFTERTSELIEAGEFTYAFSHTPYYKLKLPDRTFRITSFRDPAARIISLYRKLKYQNQTPQGRARYAKQLSWLGDSFSDFLDAIPERHLLRQLYTFSPSLDPDEAFSVIRSLNAYFFIEDIEPSLQLLSTLFDKTFVYSPPLRHFSKPLHVHEKQILHSRLKKEYALTQQLRKAYNFIGFPFSRIAQGAGY
ncbi:sulfotransferase family 2 domain-containing protein [Desulfobaculum bizertense]|uniref:Sulfotransferase family protein n=1 Tax=Desulfobaculum bizertense DSM 18034 TaxID=1121442 RepID=A0A1T4W207_9BACT|nr:sulfotransferase family 2 domain-containing protein [Desulfobaculum bizertense]SKA71300.1 Sulfotransferase family protein [Desulfobaculum bizertense DSM 18034]